jgi:glycerophosphoryl diester phosphodiesterase
MLNKPGYLMRAQEIIYRMSKTSLILLSLLTFSSCHRHLPKSTTAMNNFDWQGHRGARGLVPENSIPAFFKALEFPHIKTLELDLAVSADQQLVVSHEPWMSALICQKPDGSAVQKEEEEKLLLYQMTYAQIAQYDCGSRGNSRFPEQKPQKTSKPLLKDVVAAVNEYCRASRRLQPFYNIELKSEKGWEGTKAPAPAEFAQLVLAEIKKLGIEKRTCLQSFDPRCLQEIRKQSPKQTIALLVENLHGFEANLADLGFHPDIYSPYFKLLNAEVVKKAHEMGIKVVPWTVNETAEMQKMLDLGVDGVITDYPDRVPGLGK